jgi:hypothetical protein
MYICREPGMDTVSMNPVYMVAIKTPVRMIEGAKCAERQARRISATKAIRYRARGGWAPVATSSARQKRGKILATRAEATSTRRMYIDP